MDCSRSKELVIDGKGHVYGRLAARVAKAALEGQKVTVVRAEELVISRSQFRNRLKFMEFLRKHCNSNPTKRSHIHYREPSKMFKRAVRGMLPHKTQRGAAALKRITVVEGIPGKWDRFKRFTCPEAAVTQCLRTTTPKTRLGSLASSVGWKGDEIVKRLEAVRKEKSHERFVKRLDAAKAFRARRAELLAQASGEIKSALQILS
uniref:Large ribosomal subunit protein uL13 n=1 Tax=Dermatophagoides pteronyssinus TaxID=6956 RepID=A0A6P6Y7S4_DERPT|nr:60S ribosomal protein L13a-like [Dermatophagoides pteronyssinus]